MSMAKPGRCCRNRCWRPGGESRPVVPVLELKAYSISLKPCGPPLLSVCFPSPSRGEAGEGRGPSPGRSGWRAPPFISYAWIFLPMYSGVRPTISPARNTANRAKKSMPVRPGASPRTRPAQLDVGEGNQAAERVEAVVHGVDGAAGGDGGDDAKRATAAPETDLLASRFLRPGRSETSEPVRLGLSP